MLANIMVCFMGYPKLVCAEFLQSYLWENKTVKGGLLWELPLSVHSDLKLNLTRTLDIIYFSPVWPMAKIQYKPRPMLHKNHQL